MQKLTLKLAQQQRLTPQQIMLIKLLEVPTAELDTRVEEELEINPALEQADDNTETLFEDDNKAPEQEAEANNEYDYDDLHLQDYLGADDKGYKMSGDGPDAEDTIQEVPLADETSLIDSLHTQLMFLGLDERQTAIGDQIIGSLDDDGYLRRKPEAIANDLAFTQNIYTDEDEVLSILFKIQEFDPAGIAARDLQECLLLQLNRKTTALKHVNNAIAIIEDCFEEFSKKHYDKIKLKLGLGDDELKAALKEITKCNPKPGGFSSASAIKSQYLIPDFIITNQNGELEITLNSKNAPELRVSTSYLEMFDTYEKSAKADKKMKEAVTFVKQKLDAAKWFIEAIKQRQHTLLQTMEAIVALQHEYFITGDESKLKPMILKDIAEKVHMDVSTVSRVAASKTVQTDFGIFPLKYFFSEGITHQSGEDVSAKEVKNVLLEIIENEDKANPLSDEALEQLMKEKGFSLARRTIAKYREQLNIPVARLRKGLF